MPVTHEVDSSSLLRVAINILTFENLLFLCGDDQVLITLLKSCFDVSTENCISEPVALNDEILKLLKTCAHKESPFIKLKHKETENDLINELCSIKKGKTNKASQIYEKYCEKTSEDNF